MTPVRITKTLAAASANGIAQSQTLAAAGDLNLNGGLVVAGVAQLGSARRVAIISGGNDSGKTATIYGTNDGSTEIHEVAALTNGGTVTSSLDFLTVSRIAVSAAAATTLTAGTSAIGSTPWIMPSYHLTPFNVDILTQVSGSVTYSIQVTQDDYWAAGRSNYDPTPIPRTRDVITGSTTALQQTLDTAVTGFRLTITAGNGTLSAEATQAGIANY